MNRQNTILDYRLQQRVRQEYGENDPKASLPIDTRGNLGGHNTNFHDAHYLDAPLCESPNHGLLTAQGISMKGSLPAGRPVRIPRSNVVSMLGPPLPRIGGHAA
jgi:hypothetical protein